MKAILVFILSYAAVLSACSQRDSAEGLRPEIVLKTLRVGASDITFRQTFFETDPPFLLLQLHSNETTTADAAGRLSQQEGLPFFQLVNSENRLVTFLLEGKQYQFDPNRVFSDEGIAKTLTLTSRLTDTAFAAVQQFRDSLLTLLPAGKPIVAVHNNTDKNFSIRQYLQINNSNVHLNSTWDEDDFFITNDEEIFQRLKKKNVNVVLEDASQMEEDGSLSLYCNRENIRYINVEAEHGHFTQQLLMLEAVWSILK